MSTRTETFWQALQSVLGWGGTGSHLETWLLFVAGVIFGMIVSVLAVLATYYFVTWASGVLAKALWRDSLSRLFRRDSAYNLDEMPDRRCRQRRQERIEDREEH